MSFIRKTSSLENNSIFRIAEVLIQASNSDILEFQKPHDNYLSITELFNGYTDNVKVEEIDSFGIIGKETI